MTENQTSHPALPHDAEYRGWSQRDVAAEGARAAELESRASGDESEFGVKLRAQAAWHRERAGALAAFIGEHLAQEDTAVDGGWFAVVIATADALLPAIGGPADGKAFPVRLVDRQLLPLWVAETTQREIVVQYDSTPPKAPAGGRVLGSYRPDPSGQCTRWIAAALMH